MPPPEPPQVVGGVAGTSARDGALAYPGDELVTLADGRVLPLKKTICTPHGNFHVAAGARVKLTAKLREEAEREEILLRKAAQDGAIENLREGIHRGVNVNCRSRAGGATPLLCASIGGHLDAMRMLKEAGADPELGNVNCDTPLNTAAQWNHLNVVRYLLEECKLDPRVWNDAPNPESPLDRAKANENAEMVKLITAYWLKLDERDRAADEKQKKASEREKAAHRAKVSREAAERREAARIAG